MHGTSTRYTEVWAIWQHHGPRRLAATDHSTTIAAVDLACHHSPVLVLPLGLLKREHSTYPPTHNSGRGVLTIQAQNYTISDTIQPGAPSVYPDYSAMADQLLDTIRDAAEGQIVGRSL